MTDVTQDRDQDGAEPDVPYDPLTSAHPPHRLAGPSRRPQASELGARVPPALADRLRAWPSCRHHTIDSSVARAPRWCSEASADR
jgi:hypothetical protein